jgi:alkanesulfonate monooxygenase SsuD/methylene tetrahydromethanopterin reductase-like flavin-dependent oxidoreductase (luciferase family)
MRLAAILLQTKPWASLAQDFRDIEDAGYDVAYVADHLTHPTMPGQWMGDGWSVLAAAAGVVGSLDLGTLVASSAYRSPVVLARTVATVDDLCDGRLVFGLGAGTPNCAAADRGVAPTRGEMSRRFADMVRGLDAVFAGAGEWQGDELGFSGVETLPLSPGRQRPFWMLAAHGPRAFDLVGRYADGWSTYGGPAATSLAAPEFWALLGEQSRAVSEACERHGRDPAALRRSVLLGYGAIRPLADVASYVRSVDEAREAGFDEVVVYWPDDSAGGRFASDSEVHREGVRAVRG